jgi:hypothetical protein
MKRLALILIVVGVATGPLITARTMWVAFHGVESGQGEAAIQTGVSQAFMASFAGSAIAAIGLVILVVTWYRGRNNAVRTRAAN